MSSVRAFLAIPLPWQLQESIRVIQTELQASIAEARWTRPENLHLTLHFFGKIEQETLEKLKVSVLSVKGCQRPFQVEVKGLGAFPSPHRPRVIWLGLNHGGSSNSCTESPGSVYIRQGSQLIRGPTLRT